MARPKKSAAAARPHIVAFRLNDAEMTRLRTEGDAAGMAASDLARAKAIGARMAARLSSRQTASAETPALFALRQELNRVGVNLNQIARRLHMTGEHEPEELQNACRDLDQLLRSLLDGGLWP